MKISVSSRKAGALLARVRGVRPNPSIFREGFSNPSIFEHLEQEFRVLGFIGGKRVNEGALKTFGTPQFNISVQPLPIPNTSSI